YGLRAGAGGAGLPGHGRDSQGLYRSLAGGVRPGHCVYRVAGQGRHCRLSRVAQPAPGRLGPRGPGQRSQGMSQTHLNSTHASTTPTPPASGEPLLRTDTLVKRFGGLLVTDSVSIDVRPGEIHAIIGPNGAGKTTLINQLSGELAADSGQVLFAGQNVTALGIHKRARRGLLRSYQITSIFEGFTVLENTVLAAMGAQEHAFKFWRPMLGRADLVATAREALEVTGLLALANSPAAELAYGQRRQLELAMALAAQPKVLLLDEPMAGMSVQESAGVVELLKR